VESEGTVVESEVQGLGVFVGEFVHSLDPKKRLTIPAVWRAQVGLPRSLYVIPSFHLKCLNVLPGAEMVRKLDKLRRLSLTDRKAQDFMTTLGKSSDLVSWDVQGRIRIKDKLLEFAGLTGEVILIGAMDKFQLWSAANYGEPVGVDQASLMEAAQNIDF
jgi:MraZ protein